MRVRNSKNGHAGGKASSDAGFGVFDDRAVFWLDAEEFSRAKEDVGSGLATFDLGASDNHREKSREGVEFKDFLDDREFGAGGEGERVFGRELLDERRKAIEKRAIAADDFEDAIAFAGKQVGQRLSGFVASDEIEPEFVVGAANPIGEMDAVVVAVANFADDFEEGPLVARFAVHDDAVHIEDDGFYLVRLRYVFSLLLH